jgi:hypothetical protein
MMLKDAVVTHLTLNAGWRILGMIGRGRGESACRLHLIMWVYLA